MACCDDPISTDGIVNEATTCTKISPCPAPCPTTNCPPLPCPTDPCCTNKLGQPYYQTVGMCPEDSKKYIRVEKISQVFRNRSAFCMPGCGQKVRVVFDGVTDVATGAYMWAYGIGFLEITGFNAITQEIELRNNCIPTCTTQAGPGEPIPNCTIFVVTPPPCNGTNGVGGTPSGPFLNAGFTAPASGDCIDITVTNVQGLTVNRTVSINTGIYRISEIKSATIITICNDGTGLTPGTVVDYEDSTGNLLVPIILIDSNPCLNTGGPAGKMMICSGGNLIPLEGLVDGQIPVLNITTGEVNFRSLAIPVTDCTALTAGFTLDPALPDATPYLITVTSTADFAITDLVTIGIEDFTVDSIVDGTHMYVIPLVPPSAIQSYSPGTSVCGASCCAQIGLLETDITNIDARVTNIENNTPGGGQGLAAFTNFADAAALGAPITIDTGSPTADGNIGSLLVTNSSTVYTMGVHFLFEFVWSYNLLGSDGDDQLVHHFAKVSSNLPGDVPATVYDLPQVWTYKTISGLSGTNPHSNTGTFSGSTAIAPGASITLKGQATMTFDSGEATQVDVNVLAVRISCIGVAIQ